MVEVEVALYHVANDFELRVSWEGDLTREHDVEDDTQRPDVNLRIVVLQEHFWCNVVWLRDKRETRLETRYEQTMLVANLQIRSWSSWSLGRRSPSRGQSRSS